MKRGSKDSWLSHERYPKLLLGILAIFCAVLAISPVERSTWVLESVLLVAGIAVLILTRHKLPLSRLSYTLVFVFCMLHAVGAHYTYALVPYDNWCEALFGRTLSSVTGWQRNHYDRFVHFSYGLLLAYPVREVFQRVADVRGFWGYYFPLDVTMASSMLYELIEWAVAEAFGGGAVAYLGTQGDIWDAHKDMALASLGGLIAMLVTAAINRRYQRDFAREWAESLRVKKRRPLGEDELKRMIDADK